MVVAKVRKMVESNSTFQIDTKNHMTLINIPRPLLPYNLARMDNIIESQKNVQISWCLFNPELYEFLFKSHDLKCFWKLICCIFCDKKNEDPGLCQHSVQILSFQNRQIFEQFFEPLYIMVQERAILWPGITRAVSSRFFVSHGTILEWFWCMWMCRIAVRYWKWSKMQK